MKRLIIVIVSMLIALNVSAQKIALKTNLIYDASTTLNLGAEFKVGTKSTIDLSGDFNPWTFSDNMKMKHILVQPEYRYWFCNTFEGSYIGVHAHYSMFNLSRMVPWTFDNPAIASKNMLRSRYEGWLAGFGFSYGYHWILSRRWSIEGTLGLGYAYINYDKYPCAKCGRRIKSDDRHYVGPTKVALSLIYILK